VTSGSTDDRPILGPGGLQFAVLECSCANYPVVAGIAIVQHRDGLDGVVSAIVRGDNDAALLAALNVFRVSWARRSRWAQLRYRLDCRRMVAARDWSFEKAVDRMRRPRVFADYLLHRWANPSFLAAMAPLLLLGLLPGARAPASLQTTQASASGTTDVLQNVSEDRPVRSTVLDLACGAGHSTFVMRTLFPGLDVVSVDHDFVSLYLAKRFVAPDGYYLCLDAEVPSPFPDACFDAVFCLDAFHYFRSKAALVRELDRTSSPARFWLFPHLHNALSDNVTPGTPMPPDAYLNVFASPKGRLFDEHAMFRALVDLDKVCFQDIATTTELISAPTLTYLSGPDALWAEHPGFLHSLERAGLSLAINPIYSKRKHESGLSLELVWPNALFARECNEVVEALPPRLRISSEQRARLGRASEWCQDDELRAWARRFVLVPLPSRYMAGDGGA